MASAAVILPLWVHTPDNKARNNQLTSYATVYIFKTRKKIITSNMTINACCIDADKQRQQFSNAMMGAVQPAQ
jgi:hypothetical protein